MGTVGAVRRGEGEALRDLPQSLQRLPRRRGPARRPAAEAGPRLFGRAWAQALETARRLVSEFGAARVVAVGALLRPERFGRGSTVELVVWGLRADVFGQALAGGRGGVPAVIRDADRLPPAERARAEREGIELALRRDG